MFGSIKIYVSLKILLHEMQFNVTLPGMDVIHQLCISLRLTKPFFEIKFTPLKEMPKWRNWQTRYVQGVVSLRS